MRACLVDLRCLQDPAYAERGIGRHALNLLRHARPMLPETALLGLIDPELPSLPRDVAALLDECRSTAYTGALNQPTCHVQLSPMTHDPLFVGRLLQHPGISSAACIYDFIPWQEPKRYLATAGARLEYHISLRWLARHDLFLPISNDSAGQLQKLLRVQPSRIVVTGAALAPGFDGLRPSSPSHVLVIGGGDPRKNPECAVRAHARCEAMQAARVPLVITGTYGTDWLEEQRRTATALGGCGDLVQAPGHVPEASLLAMFANALCVVAPSYYEGFSLPVIEAMAAGIAVLASDIPAHRELLDAALFAPDDAAALSGLLQRACDPAWRAAALARQAPVWPRFRAEAVASRFWAAISKLTSPSAPAALRGARPKLAFLTPLPPDRSGVADYSAATCGELGKRVELHLFSPTESPVLPEGAASVAPLSALPHLNSTFDRVVSVLGNSTFHLDILRLMLRYGGAAIQHDGRMVDLYASHISLEHTERLAEAELHRELHPNEIWRWLAGDIPSAALLMSEIAERAEPLMVHSQASTEQIGSRYDRAAIHLPFCPYRTLPNDALTPQARVAARDRLHVRPGELVVATFGYVHPTKAPVDCLWAVELLRSWGVPVRLHFVGASMMPVEPLEQLVADLGLTDCVRLGDGYVDEQSYRDHLLAADIGLQLRTAGLGSVSGALADCIAAGLPSVASKVIADALDAPDYVYRVPDAPSPILVAEGIAAMLNRGPTDAERRAYVEAHGFDRYAARLCESMGLG